MDQRLIRAKAILTAESDAIRQIPTDDTLLNALEWLSKCQGKIVGSGIGKAGIIARKVVSTFASTGSPALFLHPGDAQHGDLGVLGSNDLLLVFSNSGKTREILELIELAKQLQPQIPVIAITSATDSPLIAQCDVVLQLGHIKEACPLAMAPTTSTTAMLALGDVLAILLMEIKGFSREEFYKRHHGGYLGEQFRHHHAP